MKIAMGRISRWGVAATLPEFSEWTLRYHTIYRFSFKILKRVSLVLRYLQHDLYKLHKVPRLKFYDGPLGVLVMLAFFVFP